MGRLFLYAISLLVAFASKADIFHYNNNLVGTRSAHLGGAYTAISDDPSGIAYNPAGLAFADNNELSGSVQGFYNNQETYRETIGDENFVEVAGGGFAPYLGSVFKTDKYLLNSAVGFSLYTTDTLIKQQNTLILDQPFGPFTVKRYFRTVQASAETAVKAGGMAKRWDGFSLGISVGLLTVAEVYQSYQKSEISRSSDNSSLTDLTLESLFETLNLTAIEPVLGALYKPTDDIGVGVSVRNAMIVTEEFNQELNKTALVLDQDDNVEVNDEGRRGMKKSVVSVLSKKRIGTWPMAIRLGFAGRRFGNLTTAFDVEHRLAATGETAEMKRNSVTNYHLGMEYKIVPELALRGGLFTNFDARPPLQESLNDQPDHIDYRGATLFAEYSMEKSSYSLGAVYQKGRGHGQKVQASSDAAAPIQNLEGNRLAILLGISHILGQECPSR